MYIALEGDLEGATEIIADFERPHYAEYFPLEVPRLHQAGLGLRGRQNLAPLALRAQVAIRGKKQMHVLKAEKLAGSIDCGAWCVECPAVHLSATRPCVPVHHASVRLTTPRRPGPTWRSKAKVSKKGDKVIITLKKLHKTNWGQLRMNVCLPYRRGGGGS